MASSPRIILPKLVNQGKSPQKLKDTLKVRDTLSPRTPRKSSNRLSLAFNVDTPNRLKILNDRFSPNQQEHSVLGCGGFGTVYKASYHGNEVAAKIIRRQKCNDEAVEAEKHAKSLHHSNIVGIFGIDQGTVCSLITMELCGKSLQDELDESDLNRSERINMWIAIAGALEFCHNAGIIHADVKPKNVLIAADGEPKLADFGSSINVNENMKEYSTIPTLHGTPGYVAPEVIKGSIPTTKSDIYSLGILAWQLLSRQIPFTGFHVHTILYLTGKGNRPNDCHLDDQCNNEYKKLYKELWSDNLEFRPSIKIIIHRLNELSKIL